MTQLTQLRDAAQAEAVAANERLVVLEAERAEDSARVVSDTEGAIRAELSAAMAACEAERERSADLARQLAENEPAEHSPAVDAAVRRVRCLAQCDQAHGNVGACKTC